MNPYKNGKKILLCLFLVLFLLLMVLGVLLFVAQKRSREQAKQQYEEMKSAVLEISPEPIATKAPEATIEPMITPEPEPIEEPGIQIPERSIDWEALWKENQDIYAWIIVPETTVDYPILQHPTDNSYYLNYNIDGSKGFPGCIYTEDFNQKDFSDPNTVIYGHNLKDKTMFSSLHNFEDKELFEKDNYIYIYTPDEVYVYQIFAAYEFPAIHLMDNYDYSNEYEYETYLKKIYKADGRVANVRQDIEVDITDKIVTLSTCTTDHNADIRFLVVGVLVNPKE